MGIAKLRFHFFVFIYKNYLNSHIEDLISFDFLSKTQKEKTINTKKNRNYGYGDFYIVVRILSLVEKNIQFISRFFETLGLCSNVSTTSKYVQKYLFNNKKNNIDDFDFKKPNKINLY